MQFVKTLNEVGARDINLVGGKASSLGEMIKAGLPVPPGFAVITDAFETGMSDELKTEILKNFDELGAERVAVRSSAVAEDSKSASWAGQLETYLNVNKSELINAVKKCWDSVNSEHAKEYASQNKVSEADKSVGVVVQKMVDSEVSGVMFTANPVSNNLDEIVLEAIYGLGELIVQGAVTPENFIINKKTGRVVSNSPSRQAKMLVYKNGKNEEVEVPDSKLNRSILSKAEIKELVNTAIRIEKHYGIPQDIEWAIENGKLYITQSRPITTLDFNETEAGLEQEFLSQNGADQVMRFEGDFMPFQLMIEWWNQYDSKKNLEGIYPVLFFFTPERTTGYISQDKYRNVAIKTFSELISGKRSFQEITDNYDKIAAKISEDYTKYFVKNKRFSSEADAFGTYKTVHEDFHELVAWTLFYEQLDESAVAEVLSGKDVALEKLWEIVKLPVFTTIDTRRKEYMLAALEGNLPAKELCFSFSDYTFFADEKFVTNELAKTSTDELKAELKNVHETISQARQKLSDYLKNTDQLGKTAAQILGWVLQNRDERKDIINKIELTLFHIAEQLFEFWDMDKDLLPYTGISDILQGHEYVKSIETDLPKRKDGFAVLYQTDRTSICGYEDLDTQMKSLDSFILSQHQDKSGHIIKGDIGNTGKASGKARIVLKRKEFENFQEGEVLVVGMTRPEYVPLMKKASAIVTDEGGITSHAAIVSRELNKPCIIGTRIATQILKTGDEVEVDADTGTVRVLKSSTYTFEKIFTREETIIFGELQRNEFAKWLATITDEPIPTLFSRTDRGLVEVWLCNESTKLIIDDIYAHNISDPAYLEKYIKIYKDLMAKMAEMEKQKHAKNLNELKQYLELFRENMIPLHIIYFTPFHPNTPKHLNDLAIKVRSEDAMFDNADIFIRDSLVHLYPQCDGYETFITLDDLNNPDSISLEELKSRTNGLFWLEGEYSRTDLEGFQKMHPNFVLKIDKVDPSQKTITGNTAYKGKVTGEAQVINLKKDVANFKPGNILVAPMTTPHYLPAMKHAKAFVTDEGGVMCHAAILAREMKTPCVIGTRIATQVIKTGDEVEVDANAGTVTILEAKKEINLSKLFGREKGVWYAYLWDECDRLAFSKYLGYEVKNNLFLREGERVYVWYDLQERDAIGTKLAEILATDKDFLSKIFKDLNEEWKILGPYLKKEKIPKNLEDLKEYYTSLRAWWLPMTILFTIPQTELPDEFVQKAVNGREQVEKYSDSMDDVWNNFWLKKALQYKNLMNLISPDEAFSVDALTVQDEQKIIKRKQGVGLLNSSLYLASELSAALAIHDIKLSEEIIVDETDIKGNIANKGVVTGKARLILLKKDISKLHEGEILVTDMTSPQYLPAIKKSAAIVTDEGGMMSHAAIVARELNKPCIIGTRIATQVIKTGDQVEVDANTGVVTILKNNVQ